MAQNSDLTLSRSFRRWGWGQPLMEIREQLLLAEPNKTKPYHYSSRPQRRGKCTRHCRGASGLIGGKPAGCGPGVGAVSLGPFSSSSVKRVHCVFHSFSECLLGPSGCQALLQGPRTQRGMRNTESPVLGSSQAGQGHRGTQAQQGKGERGCRGIQESCI